MALVGSCCSSCCSTRNSRHRWAVLASDSFPPTARDVFRPHAVPSLMPAVSERESETLRE